MIKINHKKKKLEKLNFLVNSRKFLVINLNRPPIPETKSTISILASFEI
jgi:hypothetical protein